MKKLLVVFVMLFLASCGASEENNTVESQDVNTIEQPMDDTTVEDETINEIAPMDETIQEPIMDDTTINEIAPMDETIQEPIMDDTTVNEVAPQ